MKNLYKISKSQLIILLALVVVAWIRVINSSCEWFKNCFDGIITIGDVSSPTPVADWLAVIIPFIAVFYVVGWVQFNKNKGN